MDHRVVLTQISGLNRQTKTMIDDAIRGSLMSKTTCDTYALLEEMVANNYQFPNERNILRKVAKVHDVHPFNMIYQHKFQIIITICYSH